MTSVRPSASSAHSQLGLYQVYDPDHNNPADNNQNKNQQTDLLLQYYQIIQQLSSSSSSSSSLGSDSDPSLSQTDQVDTSKVILRPYLSFTQLAQSTAHDLDIQNENSPAASTNANTDSDPDTTKSLIVSPIPPTSNKHIYQLRPYLYLFRDSKEDDVKITKVERVLLSQNLSDVLTSLQWVRKDAVKQVSPL